MLWWFYRPRNEVSHSPPEPLRPSDCPRAGALGAPSFRQFNWLPAFPVCPTWQYPEPVLSLKSSLILPGQFSAESKRVISASCVSVCLAMHDVLLNNLGIRSLQMLVSFKYCLTSIVCLFIYIHQRVSSISFLFFLEPFVEEFSDTRICLSDTYVYKDHMSSV